MFHGRINKTLLYREEKNGILIYELVQNRWYFFEGISLEHGSFYTVVNPEF